MTLEHMGWWFKRLKHTLVYLYFIDNGILLKKDKALKPKRNKRMREQSLWIKYIRVFFLTGPPLNLLSVGR